ncbi:MAG: glycosyltransferase family 2 protein [Luteolibacter sp.]
MPKFSIITPSYNQGRFLPDCIESVLSQTGVEVEHIVIDAGSTDETLQVLKAYPHLDWVSESDKGMSDGINKGFLKATGDWMMWLNCDDYLLPDVLKKVADYIESNPQFDVVHGDCLFVNEDKSLIRRKYDHEADVKMLLFVGCYIPSTSTFFDRKIIDSRHLLDVRYRVCMDWEYYLRLMRAGYRFGYIPEAIAGFRWHGDNTSVIQSQRRLEEALMLQREHIKIQGMPSWLGNSRLLQLLRKTYQVRRVLRRKMIHDRWH